MLLLIIGFSGGVYVGLGLNKEGTKVNSKWKALKKWLRALVRDNVK